MYLSVLIADKTHEIRIRLAYFRNHYTQHTRGCVLWCIRRDSKATQLKPTPAHIAAISNFWNEIETRIAIFLAALSEGEASTVITLFLAVKSDVSKRAMINSIVSMKLDDNLKPAFATAMAEIDARYEERNKIVHGGWGISKDFPAALLWADIRETTVGAVELMKLAAAGNTDAQHEFMRELLKGARIYKENDFIDIYNRMVKAFNQLDSIVAPQINRAFGGNFAASSKVYLPKK